MSSAADRVLDRLHNVRQVRPNDYYSGCPLCQSRRGRPIHVSVLDHSRVLVHPFCGCQVADVLAAVGLSLADLYEKCLGDFAPSRTGISRDSLRALDHEITVAALILADALAERLVTKEQWDRLAIAATRIGQARDHGRT